LYYATDLIDATNILLHPQISKYLSPQWRDEKKVIQTKLHTGKTTRQTFKPPPHVWKIFQQPGTNFLHCGESLYILSEILLHCGEIMYKYSRKPFPLWRSYA
jgi:hypothetical protein